MRMAPRQFYMSVTEREKQRHAPKIRVEVFYPFTRANHRSGEVILSRYIATRKVVSNVISVRFDQ